MCDIYYAKCSDKDCKVEIYMHLEDFKTDQNEIEVFCGAHLPKKNVRVFHLRNKHDQEHVIGGYKRCGVRYLTDNARNHIEGNHPNAGGAWKIEDK